MQSFDITSIMQYTRKLMHKKTIEKYHKDIKKRIGRVPNINCPTITPATKTYIQYIVSFLSEKKIKYIEKSVFFHEPMHKRGQNQEFAGCLNLKAKKAPDFFIFFDSTFSALPEDYKLTCIAHELGHVFVGHDEDVSEDENEKSAIDFVKKYFPVR